METSSPFTPNGGSGGVNILSGSGSSNGVPFASPISVDGNSDVSIRGFGDSRGNRTNNMSITVDSGDTPNGGTGNSDVPDGGSNGVNTGRGDGTPSDFTGISLGQIGNMTIPVWNPNTDLSPSENINSLTDWLNSILSYYNYSVGHSGLGVAGDLNYGNLLGYIYHGICKSPYLEDLSDSASIELAEKISDVTFTFINSQFQQALSYQSWYLQQEYNSPVNQVNRLAAAGLSSAFAIGNYSAGNAQSPASTPQVSMPSSSNAGQAEVAAESNSLGFIGQVAGTAVSLLPAVSNFISALATKKLSLKQIQKADADIINSAATEELLRTQVETAKSNLALTTFDSLVKQSNSLQQNAKQAVDSAQAAYSSALLQPKQDVELDGYEVLCHDKMGNTKKYKLTADEVEEFQKNLKEDKNGNVYIGVDKFDIYAEASGSAGVPLFGKADFKAGGNYGHSSSDEKSNSKMNQNEKANTKSKNETGYSENGTSFKDGKLTYTGVKIHRQMYLPEQKAYIDACQGRLQKALDEYDTLSTGERARMCAAADDLVRNLSKFSARTVHAMMMSKLNQHLFNKPQSVLVGD